MAMKMIRLGARPIAMLLLVWGAAEVVAAAVDGQIVSAVVLGLLSVAFAYWVVPNTLGFSVASQANSLESAIANLRPGKGHNWPGKGHNWQLIHPSGWEYSIVRLKPWFTMVMRFRGEELREAWREIDVPGQVTTLPARSCTLSFIGGVVVNDLVIPVRLGPGGTMEPVSDERPWLRRMQSVASSDRLGRRLGTNRVTAGELAEMTSHIRQGSVLDPP